MQRIWTNASAWSAMQRVLVLRHGVQVAGPRTVVRRQDRRAVGRLAPATSRLAGGRVPAALRWSELHDTQSVHVLPPPPSRPWRVRTLARAELTALLSCDVTHKTPAGTLVSVRWPPRHTSACPPNGAPDRARREARASSSRTARLAADVIATAASAASGGPISRADCDEQQPRVATSEQEADPPLRCGRDPKRRHPVLRRHPQDRPGRGCNRNQHGQRGPSPSRAPRPQAPRSPPRRRAGRADCRRLAVQTTRKR